MDTRQRGLVIIYSLVVVGGFLLCHLKFTSFLPLRLCGILIAPRLQSMLGTTDPPSVPSEDHVTQTPPPSPRLKKKTPALPPSPGFE